jgi:hypothetical protein
MLAHKTNPQRSTPALNVSGLSVREDPVRPRWSGPSPKTVSITVTREPPDPDDTLTDHRTASVVRQSLGSNDPETNPRRSALTLKVPNPSIPSADPLRPRWAGVPSPRAVSLHQRSPNGDFRMLPRRSPAPDDTHPDCDCQPDCDHHTVPFKGATPSSLSRYRNYFLLILAALVVVALFWQLSVLSQRRRMPNTWEDMPVTSGRFLARFFFISNVTVSDIYGMERDISDTDKGGFYIFEKFKNLSAHYKLIEVSERTLESPLKLTLSFPLTSLYNEDGKVCERLSTHFSKQLMGEIKKIHGKYDIFHSMHGQMSDGLVGSLHLTGDPMQTMIQLGVKRTLLKELWEEMSYAIAQDRGLFFKRNFSSRNFSWGSSRNKPMFTVDADGMLNTTGFEEAMRKIVDFDKYGRDLATTPTGGTTTPTGGTNTQESSRSTPCGPTKDSPRDEPSRRSRGWWSTRRPPRPSQAQIKLLSAGPIPLRLSIMDREYPDVVDLPDPEASSRRRRSPTEGESATAPILLDDMGETYPDVVDLDLPDPEASSRRRRSPTEEESSVSAAEPIFLDDNHDMDQPFPTAGLDIGLEESDDDGGEAKLYVEVTTGTISITIEPKMTIGQLKMKIQDQKGFPVAWQHLIFDGEQLDDTRTLEDYGIGKGQTIVYVPKDGDSYEH